MPCMWLSMVNLGTTHPQVWQWQEAIEHRARSPPKYSQSSMGPKHTDAHIHTYTYTHSHTNTQAESYHVKYKLVFTVQHAQVDTVNGEDQ